MDNLSITSMMQTQCRGSLVRPNKKSHSHTKVVEDRIHRPRTEGVNHGSIQFQRRWSDLARDFEKIKEWESHDKEEIESFWMMRNDFKREKNLPGFFIRQVFDILDH
uniref:Uncharacterized protein n=1 Tax=Solanum lycopersicum TaxID=4081 RepID=K4CRY7_SOLLC